MPAKPGKSSRLCAFQGKPGRSAKRSGSVLKISLLCYPLGSYPPGGVGRQSSNFAGWKMRSPAPNARSLRGVLQDRDHAVYDFVDRRVRAETRSSDRDPPPYNCLDGFDSQR